MEPMNTEDAKKLLAQLGTVIEWADGRIREMVQQAEGSAAAMNHSAQRLEQGGAQFGKQALEVVRGETGEIIGKGTSVAVGRVDASSQAMQQVTQQTAGVARQLFARMRSFFFIASGALLIGSVLAAVGVGFLIWQNQKLLEQAHFSQDLLQATQRGAINHCGDALCAKVGKKPQRYGQNGEYLLLQE